MEKIILMKKAKRDLSRIIVFFIIEFLIIIAVSLIGKSTLYTYADLEDDLEASYDYVENSDDNILYYECNLWTPLKRAYKISKVMVLE